MCTFLFIRHGTSEAEDFIPGRLPVSLSRGGTEQIEKLAGQLAKTKIDLLISSPVERTMQTASIISGRINLPVRINDAFQEIDFGKWTGMSFEELEKDRVWKSFHEFRSGVRVPGGELISEVQNRFINEIEKMRVHYPNKTIAVVSHGDPIRAAVCYYAGIPLDMMFRITISTGSVTVVQVHDYGPKILCINHTGELPAVNEY